MYKQDLMQSLLNPDDVFDVSVDVVKEGLQRCPGNTDADLFSWLVMTW